MLNKEICKACITKLCNGLGDRDDVIPFWCDFEQLWEVQGIVCCPVSISQKYVDEGHGDLSPIHKDKPIWCKEQ